jgi:hypothetical protein
MTRNTDKTSRWRQAPALVISLVALFAALSGAALALPGTQTVNSGDVKNESLKSIDLKDNKAVASSDVIDESLTGADVQDNSITGDDVAEATLSQVPQAANASTLNGRTASQFTSSSIYKNESAVAAGTTLGDGTQVMAAACNPGDILLSGGPANINATTTLLESFPSPGGTSSWSVRVNKNGNADNFSVVVLCADQ